VETVDPHADGRAPIADERHLQAQVQALKKERASLEARCAAIAAEYKKEQELHEASLDQLRQQMSRMSDGLAMLQEDRTLLHKEVLAEREKNQQLANENEQLKLHQGELASHIKALEDQLATMSENEFNARKFAANTRSIEDAQTDAAFRQRFNLPSTEFPITSYYCCHKHLHHGWLYITPAYVCFEPALFPNESTRIATPLTSIASIARVRGFKYIPGTDNALSFTLKSGVEYFFNNFTHRDGVIANIVQQAAKFGHRIQSNDEKQVADSGKEPKRTESEIVLHASKDTDALPATGQQLLPRATRARSLSDVG
jgi:hypothetical protein